MGNERLGIFGGLLAQLPPGHLVDVATGHGKFAMVARDQGWKVTAFDARTERFPEEEGIDWQQADVRDFVFPDDTTLVSILGLLYHLELPAVRDLLSRVSHLPLVLDTHVAIHPDDVVDGVPGRLFWENQEKATASVGNEHSFWPTELALTQMLFDVGFASVWRHVPSHAKDRTFWLCLPSTADHRLGDWTQRVGARPLEEDDLLARARLREGAVTASDLEQRLVSVEAEALDARAEAERWRAKHDRLAGHPAVRGLLGAKALARRLRP